VLIYVVLGGYRPFRGEGDECMEKIRYGIFSFHRKYWGHVSDEAKMLISRMLTVDVSRRIKAEEALESPWILSAEPRKKKVKKKPPSVKKSSGKSRSKSPKNEHY
jgi:serine/threonine protein kinase